MNNKLLQTSSLQSAMNEMEQVVENPKCNNKKVDYSSWLISVFALGKKEPETLELQSLTAFRFQKLDFCTAKGEVFVLVIV